MGGSVGKAFSNPIRAATTVATFGTSELARRTPLGNQLASLPESTANSVFGTHFGENRGGGFAPYGGGQDPLTVLAQTGGAPILGQIAMGANIDDALAGFLGVPKAEILDALNGKNSYLKPGDIQAIKTVRAQLTSIQQNRELRQQAVDKVVNDFPNIMADVSKRAGAEWDTQMKQYVDQALSQSAAKYAAGGQLSSGATAAAAARVGADTAQQRIDYTTRLAQQEYNTRLGEVNALRDFQNTMLGNQVSQGFSANQANLQRQFQGQTNQINFNNEQVLADKNNKNQSSNALFGALGSLAGTYLGGKMLLGATAVPKLNFGGGGYGNGPGFDTNAYRPPKYG